MNTFVLVLTIPAPYATTAEQRVVDFCVASTKKQAARIMLRRTTKYPLDTLKVSFYNQAEAPPLWALVTATPSGAVRRL